MSDEERPLFLVVTIKPRLDRLEEAEAQLQSMRRNSLQEPGCVFMHLVQPQDDPESWVMLEMFRSRAAWDEHMQQPYNTEGNKILEDLLREPSELRLIGRKIEPSTLPEPVAAAVSRTLTNPCAFRYVFPTAARCEPGV